MPLHSGVVCYVKTGNWNSCWRENLYYSAIATEIQHLRCPDSVDLTTVLIILTHGFVSCLGYSSLGGREAGLAQGYQVGSGTLLFVLMPGRRGNIYLKHAESHAGRSPCTTLQKYFDVFACFTSTYSTGPVGPMVKHKVKRVRKYTQSKWEEGERKYLLDNTLTCGNIQAPNDGGGDRDWYRTRRLLRYFAIWYLYIYNPEIAYVSVMGKVSKYRNQTFVVCT